MRNTQNIDHTGCFVSQPGWSRPERATRVKASCTLSELSWPPSRMEGREKWRTVRRSFIPDGGAGPE